MIQVRRLGHATISTPDMDGQIDYYGRILGLRVAEQSKDRAILVSKQGFEAIELVRGEKGQLKRLSFQIAPGTDLNDVVKELRSSASSPRSAAAFLPASPKRSRSPIRRARRSTSMPSTSSTRRRSRATSTCSSSATSPIACSTCSRS